MLRFLFTFPNSKMTTIRIRTAHTPGPWYVEATHTNQFLISLKDGSTIATIGEYVNEGGSLEQLEANARLIAAAPKLLRSCEELLERINLCRDLNDHDERTIRRAERALRKAYGIGA